MHRVELKGEGQDVRDQDFLVPNAPCGVESFAILSPSNSSTIVPNAPCGVERFCNIISEQFINNLFLMHRVELKDKII